MQMATILLIQTMRHIRLTTAHTIKMSTTDLIDFSVVTVETTITMMTAMMMVLIVAIDMVIRMQEEIIG